MPHSTQLCVYVCTDFAKVKLCLKTKTESGVVSLSHHMLYSMSMLSYEAAYHGEGDMGS